MGEGVPVGPGVLVGIDEDLEFNAPIFGEYGLLPVLIGFGLTAIVLVAVTRGRLGVGVGVGAGAAAGARHSPT